MNYIEQETYCQELNDKYLIFHVLFFFFFKLVLVSRRNAFFPASVTVNTQVVLKRTPGRNIEF